MYKGTRAECGTTTKYRYGCRCGKCVTASREYWAEFRKRNRERLLLDWREQHKRNKIKRNEQSKEYDKTHKEQSRQRIQEKRRKCLEHYSDGTVACKCCNENTYEFLSLDHINGGGTQHRRILRKRIESWLVQNNFPEGYQVLCHNCNMAKGYYGKCPHEGQ